MYYISTHSIYYIYIYQLFIDTSHHISSHPSPPWPGLYILLQPLISDVTALRTSGAALAPRQRGLFSSAAILSCKLRAAGVPAQRGSHGDFIYKDGDWGYQHHLGISWLFYVIFMKIKWKFNGSLRENHL